MNALTPGLNALLAGRLARFDLTRLALPALREAVLVMTSSAGDLLHSKLPRSYRDRIASAFADVVRVEGPLTEAAVAAEEQQQAL